MNTPLDPMRGLFGSTPIQPTAPGGPAQVGGDKTADGKTFADVLKDFVNQVDETASKYDDAIKAVERGETDNLHRVMLAQSEAQISLKLATEVRNKLVEAYKEVMRTQF
jgi:flagellar hook-basal body complex protein FliE